MTELILLIILLCAVGILLYLVVRLFLSKSDISSIETAINKVGFDQKIGEIKSYNEGIKEQYLRLQTEMERNVGELKQFASDVRTDYRSLDTMLRVPQQRGALGEMALESILSDQLPPDMFGIRQKINGKTPDAHIKSVIGIICIDSKFPLDNFKRMMDTNDESERVQYKNDFVKNVRAHIQKIKDDYVRPDLGFTDFAFAFIPSESVFQFLIEEVYDETMKWTKDGVQIVSPLTLSHKVALVRSGVHAKKLSDDARSILQTIQRLKKDFEGIDTDWKTFFSSHLSNAWKKAQSVDESYKKLRQTFDSIEKME